MKISQNILLRQTSQKVFWGVSFLLFIVSVVITIIWASSMSEMGGMQMPGGWIMSMTWMLMPGQNWFFASLTFMGMWIVMMIAMMLPSLAPNLERYRQVVDSRQVARIGWLTTLVGAGYLFIWTVFGMLAFSIGILLADIEMQQPLLSRAVPIIIGVVVLIAGLLQFTKWKGHHLACYLEKPNLTLPARVGSAWRYGLRLGLNCVRCCANHMIILLVIGVMDLNVMVAITAAITIERLVPGRERVAKVIGTVIAGAGLFLIVRAATLA